MTGPDRPSGAGTFWLAVVDAGSSLADSRAAAGPPITAIRSRFVVGHPAFLPGIRTLASPNTPSMSRHARRKRRCVSGRLRRGGDDETRIC